MAARGPNVRGRLFGKNVLAGVTADYESRLATWNEWQPVAVAAAGS